MAKKWLKIVYTEKNPAKLKLHYKSWAKEYDKDLSDWGYAYPKRLKEIILSKKIKRGCKFPTPLKNFNNLLFRKYLEQFDL